MKESNEKNQEQKVHKRGELNMKTRSNSKNLQQMRKTYRQTKQVGTTGGKEENGEKEGR